MKDILWMGLITLLCTGLWADITHKDVVEYKVDYFELNHRYDDKGKLTFDQMILWEWEDYRYLDEDNRISTRREPKVTDWYMVTKYRQKITEEEQRKKNKELADAWVKKYGKGSDHIAPEYNPPFLGGTEIPRLSGQYWKVIIVKKNYIVIIYATSFVETWTQFDPEVENQKLFSTDTRKHYLKRNPHARFGPIGEADNNSN